MEAVERLTSNDYLDQVNEAWERTIAFALLHGATDAQIIALDDLSRQFGSGSKRRLAHLWNVRLDRDGDVILLFSRHEQSPPWVQVVIDPFGVISMKNDRGEEWMSHPGETEPEITSPGIKKRTGATLDFNLMRDVLEPAYQVDEKQGRLYISDFSRWFYPFIPAGTYRPVWATSIIQDRQVEGFAVPVSGGPAVYFKEIHRDKIDDTSFFLIFKLSYLDVIKAWLEKLRIRAVVKLNLRPPARWLFNPARFYQDKIPVGITIM